MSEFFVAANERSKLQSIYKDWQLYNGLYSCKYLTLAFMASHLILIPYDILTFGEENIYSMIRLFSIGIFSFNFILIDIVKRKSGKARERLQSVCLLYPATVFGISYHYFVLTTPQQNFWIVEIGTLMVIFLATFGLHKHWREQYTFNLLNIASLGVLSVVEPSMIKNWGLLAVANVFSSITAAYFRREFVGNLFSKYNSLKRFLPQKVARILAVVKDSSEMEKYFTPKMRYTVCLCSDWRDFQELCQNRTSDEISAMLESYYDLVHLALEEQIPDGSYYATWVADELFVIFYSENDDEILVKKRALGFASAMAHTVAPQIEDLYGNQIRFDIGMSSGHGFLGLQGPKNMKKTTITGEVAGKAKRMESEAKLQRQQANYSGTRPTIVMDRELARVAEELEEFAAGKFEGILAQSKNIENESLVRWAPDFDKAPIVPFLRTKRAS